MPLLPDRFSKDAPDDGAETNLTRTALVTGSVAAGALLTGALLRLLQDRGLIAPTDVPPAVGAARHEMEIMEGQARYYHRPGEGVPIVFVHSINAAGSSHEMAPLFEHFAASTSRPLFALDWLGFGASDRPPVAYSPSLYIRQLRRFLSEHVSGPADVVALSLGGEYAAAVACELPFLVRRLVLIAPTALGEGSGPPAWVRAVVSASGRLGAFLALYHRLTRPAMLRQFYARQIFHPGTPVPDALVDYAAVTTRVRGASHAPERFIAGRLFMRERARTAYARLAIPALIVLPEDARGLIQEFGRLGETLNTNPVHLSAVHMPTGLMPHWEQGNDLPARLDAFLDPTGG